MATGVIISTSPIPASDLFSQTVLAIIDTVNAAKGVLIQKENFKKFSTYLEILKELLEQNLDRSKSLENALETINREIKVAKHLALECRKRNRIYILITCRKIVKLLEGSTKEIGRALSLIPLTSLDVSLDIKNRVIKLSEDMLGAAYWVTAAEDAVVKKIELGIQGRNFDRSCANQLLVHIAEAIGISPEQSELKKEFEEFKREVEDATLRKDLAEDVQMEQIITLLKKADATTSLDEKKKKYIERRNALGRQPLEPLQSFYCPITQAVMVDPVETTSGRTFERSAIEKCFAEGNNLCPLTMVPLNTSVIRPNKTLRESIEEWRERNTIINIVSIKPRLQSSEETEMLQSLSKLQDICTERVLHREWMTMEDYIPVLVGLLSAKNREIRKHALFILFMLAKDSDDNKVPFYFYFLRG